MIKTKQYLKQCKIVLSLLLLFIAEGGAAQVLTDTTYVYFTRSKRLDVYPPSVVKDYKRTSKRVTITTTDGEAHVYRLSLIDSITTCPPDSLPRITSFKFNNKFNDQVFTDAIGEIEGDSLIRVTVNAIGKYLTPSYQLSDKLAVAYVDSFRQESKESRLRFDKPLYFTVSRPGWQIIGRKKSAEPEVPVYPVEDVVTPVSLTAECLSTNAPSNYPDSEGLDKLLDDDLSTFFHSTWGSGDYEKLPEDQSAYLQVELPESLSKIQFSFTNRGTNNYHVVELSLQASNDGQSWKSVRSFSVDDDDLPTDPSGVYESPTIDLGGSYKYLRFEATQCAHKNYLVWAEFSISKVETPTPVTPTPLPNDPSEDEELEWTHFGRTYRVTVDWPSDRTVMTPSIYIDIEDGEIVTSKDYYLNATFRIDGAGLFPDMEETPVQIKGRGNSSWSTPSGYYDWRTGEYYWNDPKNPYRLKFAEKVKPFGLTKGKNWVLQANKQSNSMMANAIGMKAAHLMGAVAANHVVPVELYINGEYRGSYIFNEKVGFSNNSVDLDDESQAFLLELDSYSESGQFRTKNYNLPTNIKEPDFDDPNSDTQLTYEAIQNDFNAFVEDVYMNRELSNWVDVEYLASFLSVNDLIINYELMHPKSTYLYKESLYGDSHYIFGPVWDLDWGYGYESNHNYCLTGATDNFYKYPAHTFRSSGDGNGTELFWRKLRYNSEAVDRAYFYLWTKFMTFGGIDELIDFCDDYYQYANPSFIHNADLWGDGRGYSGVVTNAKKWLRQRANAIYKQLTPYDDILDVLTPPKAWKPSKSTLDNDDPEDTDGIPAMRSETLFTVYDLRGVLLKRNANFRNWRDGLTPGLYIVNGHKVMVR